MTKTIELQTFQQNTNNFALKNLDIVSTTRCGQAISERLANMFSHKRKASSELAAATKKLQIKDVRDKKNFPSKRKFATGEESPNKKPKPTKNGQRPVFTMYLSWEGYEKCPSEHYLVRDRLRLFSRTLLFGNSVFPRYDEKHL